MFKKISLFIVVAALAGFVTQLAQAVIVHGTIWSKQREDGTHQMVYCLSDYHHSGLYSVLSNLIPQYGYIYGNMYRHTLSKIVDGLDKICQKQKKQLYHALRALVQNETIVLVEDIDSDTNGHRLYTEAIEDNKNSFLRGITPDCIRRDISVINLECRQNKSLMACYISWLGMTDAQLEKQGINRSEVDSLKRSFVDMQKETRKSTQEIGSYINGPFLNIYNTKKLIKHDTLRNNFIEKVIKTNTYDPLQAALLDSPLLDLKAINHIHASDRKHIVLAMGAAHIQGVVAVLPALGYEKVYESGCMSEDIEEVRNSVDSFPILETIMNHGRTFNVASFIGSIQLQCVSDEVLIGIKPKPVNVFDPDKLLVSMVSKYPTRFPFCLFLPKVAQYLTKEEQLKTLATVDNATTIQSITQDGTL